MNIINTNLNFKQMDTRSSTQRIILHHAAAKKCSAEDIHRWHLNNGWSGAGYHFLVRKDGTIYRLRPEDKVGAHAYGANYDSLGICFEGDYKEEIMQEEEIKAGRELVNFLKNKNGLNCPLFLRLIFSVHLRRHIKYEFLHICHLQSHSRELLLHSVLFFIVLLRCASIFRVLPENI